MPSGPEQLSPICLYVLTRAVDNVVRTANYEGKEFAQSKTFENQLMRLIFGFLGCAGSRTPAWRCQRHVLKPASGKRQCTKSREMGRDAAARFGFLRCAPVLDECALTPQIRVTDTM